MTMPNNLPKYEPMLAQDALPGDAKHNAEALLTKLLQRKNPHDDLVGEPKLDGNRGIIRHHEGEVRITMRRGGDQTDYYPGVVQNIPVAVQHRNAVVDGELLAIVPPGQAGHQEMRSLLQQRQHKDLVTGEYLPRVVFTAFDLLELDGKPLIREPFQQRRSELEKLWQPQPAAELCPQFTIDEFDLLFDLVEQQKLEGYMLKDPKAPYSPGRRTNATLKVKTNPHHL